ncbi:MAG TPA: alpha-hydroxy acid oxidase [Thermoanaerobaculia bacterium]|nr:alpha-hydroxy acid oxidase [Thermoanaerobaculia bacterium]
MAEPLNIEDFETLARGRLEASVYGYFAGGSDDEITVRSNREAFQSLCLKYRVLVDVSQIDLSTRLAGISLSFPLLLAPTALQRMAHPEGEKATARAAAATGTLLTLSTVSSVALEEVAAAAPKAPLWFQLYHFNDRGLTERLVRRAEQAGYGAIVLTVDAPMLGRRERDLRNAFTLPEGVRAVHFDFAPRSERGISPLAAYINQPSVDWKDLDWTRSLSGLPLFLKGIVRGDDARRGVESGVAGIWVSNHGGRQLDTAIPTARALPEVVDAVAGRVPVIVDGGIRRGTDIVKAIALGANAVAIGRPALWGLAARGEDGVREVIEMFRRELYLAMALAGCRSISEIDRSLIAS